MPLSVFASPIFAQVGSQPLSGQAPLEPLSLARILAALPIIAIELTGVALLCGGLHVLTLLLLRAAPIPAGRSEWRDLRS